MGTSEYCRECGEAIERGTHLKWRHVDPPTNLDHRAVPWWQARRDTEPERGTR